MSCSFAWPTPTPPTHNKGTGIDAQEGMRGYGINKFCSLSCPPNMQNSLVPDSNSRCSVLIDLCLMSRYVISDVRLLSVAVKLIATAASGFNRGRDSILLLLTCYVALRPYTDLHPATHPPVYTKVYDTLPHHTTTQMNQRTGINVEDSIRGDGIKKACSLSYPPDMQRPLGPDARRWVSTSDLCWNM